jgi:hypothetical protein
MSGYGDFMRCTAAAHSPVDDELVQQMHDDLYDGLKEEIEEGVEHPAGARLGALRSPDRGARRRHAHRRRGLPRRHPVRAGSAAGGQRHEGRHVHPAPLLAETGAPRSARW